METGRMTRQLYTKRYGHGEWVTSVTYLDDGTLASAAMDAKICVWAPSGVRCLDLLGHSGSISALKGLGSSIVSVGYDQTVRVWDSRSGAETALLTGHKGPVLCLAIGGDARAVTGGRDSLACAWDIAAGTRIGRMAGHTGHVTASCWLRDGVTYGDGAGAGDLFATGAQDGHVRVWDLRARRAVANVPVHVTEDGAGAVGDIGLCTATSPFDVVSAGADQSVCVLDSRAGFAVRHRMEEHHDFIYSLRVNGRIAVSGAGDGTMIAHDVVAGKALWAVGANEAAVRCIEGAGDTLIASGDDGNAIVYKV
jgi:F-box/WD-40 domain protein 7